MNTNLQQYFPMIKSREKILQEIKRKDNLNATFNSWRKEQQEEFLDFCSGAKGVKILYDSFIKEILNPETVPERLEDLLSLLLNRKVKIIKVYPTDSSRLAEEKALLEMDFLVQLEDGSRVNVEIQKIGYRFPGQRSACYSADLLLRQYKAARSQARNRSFSYKDVQAVYTIIFFEKSPKQFLEYPEVYRHYFQQKSNSGIEIDLLQKYQYITLDIYMKYHRNGGIHSRLDAWLTFLASDKPDDIIEVIEKYPDFRELYEHIYTICQNIEGVMNMFSEELRIMDRNTARLMIDEMQEELEELQKKLQEEREELQKKSREELEELQKKLRKEREELQRKSQEEREELQKKLQEETKELQEERKKTRQQLLEKDEELFQKDQQVKYLQEEIKRLKEEKNKKE